MEQEKDDRAANDPRYYYRDAGIVERHGRVPPWLWAVAAALTIWGIYYLVANWSPPPG